ncbi:MAG: serine hydrolase domain-containing protein [Jatrophihabitans sp.]
MSSTSAPQDSLDYFQNWLGYRQWFLRIPGVQVAVTDHGRHRISAAFGRADLSSGQPLTVRHLFRVASHSKTFTAVAVLQLVEAGRLRLDDTVADRLPELAGSALAGVRVRELLGHGGGVIRDSQDGDFWQLHRNFPDREQLLAIAAEPAAAVLARNDRFKYSNIGYGLLGLIIEAVTGASYQDWVGEAIIARLGLADTGPELVESRRAELAAGHSALSYADERVVLDHVDTGALAAATGFYATAADLAEFYTALLPGDDRLLGEDSLRELGHRQWQVKQGVSDYGLGVFLTRIGDRELIGHSGGYPGHITRTLACPDRKLAVSVLTNAIDGAADPLATALFRLLEMGDSASHAPAGTGAARFTGRFRSLWGVQDVALINDRLFLLNPAVADPTDDPAPLEVIDADTLKIVGGPGGGSPGEFVRYHRGTDGSIRSVRGVSALTMTPFAVPQTS